MRLLQILTFTLFPLLLFADSLVVEKEILFTATHQFKKINGKVKDFQISPIQIQKSNGSYKMNPFQINIPLKEMKTGDSNRDAHMMEALGFPDENEIQLNIQKSEVENQKYKIDFTIKIKGITKELSTIAEVKELENGISILGSFIIQLDKFQIEPPKLLFIKMENDVKCSYKFFLKIEK